ncbi:MAG TPA: 2-amino-4-hydroxy-6-hydroxymethyldihydropteridine diphosphokinase [Rhodothermales bacterium]
MTTIGQIVYIALGSNLGDRFSHLEQALHRLADAEGVAVRRVSSVYETAAHTAEPGELEPDFLNAVVELDVDRSPESLLELCMSIEREAGRERRRRWAPRTIDLDVILFGDRVIDEPDLHVPHPRLAGRRFVLQPLADLAPDLVLPVPPGTTVYSLLERTPDRGEVRRYPRELTLPP